jgi:hypothetical protein
VGLTQACQVSAIQNAGAGGRGNPASVIITVVRYNDDLEVGSPPAHCHERANALSDEKRLVVRRHQKQEALSDHVHIDCAPLPSSQAEEDPSENAYAVRHQRQEPQRRERDQCYGNK